VGRMDWETPLGSTIIASKQKDPAWRPPRSLKEEALADGEIDEGLRLLDRALEVTSDDDARAAIAARRAAVARRFGRR
ncbi:hypothetical protein DF186_19190, partial [Enterococcus hirae]